MRHLGALTPTLVLLVIFSSPAHADVINIGVFFGETLKPYVNAAVDAAIFVGLAWFGFYMKTKWGIDIDEKYRQAVHDFAKRQASDLVNKGAVKVEGLKIEVDSKALADAANMALSSLPMALNHFNINPNKVAEMIKSYVPSVPAVAAEVQSTETPAS